ncbi:potassium transporter 1 isoform X1 [Cryptomeria japonica]|uniref:potassium transporter 1 isoform X1 n=1 Tax=Cryptomeria japonica TaxID=3369 RepID=UPI0027D9E46B|nr:potassium transporter 1 isoform X1 [Cryptomeria japonica]
MDIEEAAAAAAGGGGGRAGGAVRQRCGKKASYATALALAYQSLGVVYGDLSTSPLYVYKSTFSGDLALREQEDEVLGVLSFILWTFTLIPLCKYVFFVLTADDNGEGGTFALYSLLCRHANLSLLPNQQALDEQVSTYHAGVARQSGLSYWVKAFLEKRHKFRVGLLLVVLLGTSMVIGDGVLTPAISVLSAVQGIKVKVPNLQERYVVIIACVILVALFALQHFGTRNVAFLFAPIVIAWLICISSIGVYNIIHWNPKVFRAISPVYMYNLLKKSKKVGWESLGGIVLCITGAEAMFADLGHFSQSSIKIAFTGFVYPCLVLAYMGEAAYLCKHPHDLHRSFYRSVPEAVFWPVFIVATLAAVVGSQAVISATFSIVNQCSALSCFPRVKVVHTSNQIYGQIYIPEVNWILMCLCLTVTIGFKDTNMIGHAYGLAVTTVMFVTTCLMALVIIMVWQRNIFAAGAFFIFFGSIELLYISACLIKVLEGGWVPLALSSIVMAIMCIWHYGTSKKYEFDLQNKVSMETILSLGPGLGIVRVPGIGLIYTELVTGVPAIFGHFVANLPAFHKVLVFICIKSVHVPYVPIEERCLIGRIGPKEYRMFRCIVRYGYKDIHHENNDFENHLVMNIAEFMKRESEEDNVSHNARNHEFCDRMSVFGTPSKSLMKMVVSEDQEGDGHLSYPRSPMEEPVVSVVPKRKKKVRFEVPVSPEIDSGIRKELMELVEAKDAGVAYILGHSYVKAKRPCFILKKFAIDFAYTFLKKNCRGPSISLGIPHISLIEVGMIYYV